MDQAVNPADWGDQPAAPVPGYRSEKDMGKHVGMLTPDEQNWGEEKGTHDIELQREIDRAKSPKIKAVLLEEQAKRAERVTNTPVDWGDKPADPASPQATPEQKDGPGFWEQVRDQSLPATLGKFAAATNLETATLRQIAAKVNGVSELDRERERRLAAGEKADPASLMKWATEQARERIHGKPPPDVPVLDQLKALKDAAVSDPLKFGKGLLISAAAHPEFFMLGPLGGAFAGFTESAMEQHAEKGNIDYGEANLSAVMAGAPAAVVHSAIHVANLRTAKARVEVPTPEAEVKAAEQVKTEVKAGAEPTTALGNVLDAMGVVPEERAALVKDAKEAIDSAPEKPAAEQPPPESLNKAATAVEPPPETPSAAADALEYNKIVISDAPRADEFAGYAGGNSPEALKAGSEMAGQLAEGMRNESARQAAWLKTKGYDSPADVPADKRDAIQAAWKAENAPPVDQPLPDTVPDIRAIAPEIGWAEQGGRIIREQRPAEDVARGGVDQGEVVGRTSWVPKSDFWPNRPDKRLTEKQAYGVLDKVERGDPLTPIEKRFVQYAYDKSRERGTESAADLEARLEREAIQWEGNQRGRIDPKVLAALGAVGIGAGAAYAFTGDRAKSVQAAMAIGAAALGVAIAARMGRAVRRVFDTNFADKSLKPITPFAEFRARPQQVEGAILRWSATQNALLTGIKNKDAARTRVRDWLQGYRDMGDLTPKEQAYANEVRMLLDTTGSMAKDAGVIEQLRENYLTGMYQKKPFQSWRDVLRQLTTDEAFKGNYTGMSRNSRYNLQKVIPDYRTAEKLHAEGKFPLIPLTNDPVKIAGQYVRAVQKTMAVRKLIDDLKATDSNRYYEKTGAPVPVIIPMAVDEALGRIVKAKEKAAQRADAPPEAVEAMKRTAVMDARTDYVMVKHPSLNGLLVHKDVAPMLKMVFDTSDTGMVMNGLYAATMATKSLFFTMSMFHPVALGMVAATLALPRLRAISTLPKYYREIPGVWRMVKNSNVPTGMVKRAAEADLEFYRPPQDVDPNIVSRVLNYAQQALGPVGLPLKGMRIANDWVQHFLWGQVFPTLKLASFNAEADAAILRNPKGDPKLIDRQIAKATNDMFGGQNWFNLANDVPGEFSRRLAMSLFSPYGRKVQQIMFLSPDWNISATRAWYEGMKSVMPGIDRKASDSMYRNYLVWSGLTYLGAANWLSNMHTGQNIWDQKDWTYVNRGDGTKIQLNKHFMEMAHLTMSPQKFFLNKLAILPREAVSQFFGKDWVSWDDAKGIYGPPMKEQPFGLTRPAHALGTVMPLSIANIVRDPGQGLAGMFGVPIYGTKFSAREEEAAAKAKAAGKSENDAVERVRKSAQRKKDAERRP